MASFALKTLLFTSTLLLPIAALPTLDKRATVNRPKLGYELECRELIWVSTDNLEGISNSDIKGKTMLHPGIGNKVEWKPTAEVFNIDPSKVVTEIIIDGGKATEYRGVPLIANKSIGRPLGTEIVQYMSTATAAWANGGAAGNAEIEGFTDRDPKLHWQLQETSQALSVNQLNWMLQVTTPFPLGRLLKIVPSMKRQEIIDDGLKDPLEASELVDDAKFKIIDSCLFPYKTENRLPRVWEDNEIGDDVRAYVSLLIAYIKPAFSANKETGAKHSSSIMPRTDFKAMYRELVQSEIQKIVKEMSDANNYWNKEYAGLDKTYEGTKIKDFTSWIYALCVVSENCQNPASHHRKERKRKANPGNAANTFETVKIPSFENVRIAYEKKAGPKKQNKTSAPTEEQDKTDAPTEEEQKEINELTEELGRPPTPKELKEMRDNPGSTIKKWLDGIADGKGGVDEVTKADRKFRNGQVGGLGDTFEHAIGNPNVKLPIFEFRDIEKRETDKIPDWLDSIEQEIRAAHAGNRGVGKRAVPATTKKDNKKKKNKKNDRNPGCIKMPTSTSTTSSATSTKTSTSSATPAAATTTSAAPATTSATSTSASATKPTPTPTAKPAADNKDDDLEKKRQELLDRQAANEASKNSLSQNAETKSEENKEDDGNKKCSGKGFAKLLCKVI